MNNVSSIQGGNSGLLLENQQNHQITANFRKAFIVTQIVNKLENDNIYEACKMLKQYEINPSENNTIKKALDDAILSSIEQNKGLGSYEYLMEVNGKIDIQRTEEILACIKKAIKRDGSMLNSGDVISWISFVVEIDDELSSLLNDLTKKYLQTSQIKEAKTLVDNLEITVEQEVLNQSLEKNCQKLYSEGPKDINIFKENIDMLLVMGAEITEKAQQLLEIVYRKQRDKQKIGGDYGMAKYRVEVLSTYMKTSSKLLEKSETQTIEINQLSKEITQLSKEITQLKSVTNKADKDIRLLRENQGCCCVIC